MPADDQYFAARPAVRSKPGRARLELPEVDHALVLRTDSGVFSAGGVDPGTRVLLEDGARPEPSDRVLADVGCGYGPIAVALALRAPEATVWAVDVNERALELTITNAETLGVADRVRVATPDAVPADLVVDRLWSNPPIRVGKAALHAVLDEWLVRLVPGGRAHLVVARNLGADSLHRWLGEQGHAVTRRSSRRGYRLLDVTPVADEGPSTPLALLGDRTFGPFFAGNLVSNAGNWFQNLAASVVVYELTRSNTLVGLVSVLQFAATLVLSPWAGVAGDRYDRRRLLIGAQLLSAAGAGSLAVAVVVLGVDGLGGPLPVFAATVVIGVGYAVSVPMVQAIVPQLVRAADLDGAIALSSVTFNLARAIGPALAGALIAGAGAAAAFGVNAASFLVMVAVLLVIRPRPAAAAAPGADRSLRAGLRWVRADQVAVPVLLATLAMGWASDPVNTLSPAVVDQLGRSDGFVGALVSAFGAGAAASALVVERIRRRLGHRGSTRLGLFLVAVGMVGLAAATVAAVALVALAVAGVGFLVGITSLNGAMQRRVPEELRARVMALWSVALLGTRPLAAVVDGGLADLTSVSTSLVVAGVVPLVAVVALARATLDPSTPDDG